MSSPLTAQQLDEIETRTNAATPGPWFIHEDWPGRVFAESEFNAHVARVTGSNPEPNEKFIAAARTDVPALLAEVRRLTAELADFSGRVNELESKLCDCEPVREHEDYKRPAFYQHEPHCPVTELTQPAAEETHVVADNSSATP